MELLSVVPIKLRVVSSTVQQMAPLLSLLLGKLDKSSNQMALVLQPGSLLLQSTTGIVLMVLSLQSLQRLTIFSSEATRPTQRSLPLLMSTPGRRLLHSQQVPTVGPISLLQESWLQVPNNPLPLVTQTPAISSLQALPKMVGF